ncbi:MAG: c-type cytochrome [Gemmatimonadaceae bacterium]
MKTHAAEGRGAAALDARRAGPATAGRAAGLIATALAVVALCLPNGTARAQASSVAPAGAKPAAGAPRTGAQVFATTCAACHQAKGEGTDVYPPLAGSEWVQGDESRVVRIILHGLIGDVEVQGQVYNGAMPAWGPSLSDAEIAAVATYIRSSFGNKALPITAATVAEARAAHAGRTTPWTIPELLLIKVGEKK